MKKEFKSKYSVTKKGRKFIVTESETGKCLYKLIDIPSYDAFGLERPVLSGIASINIFGNHYSFRKYLSHNNDSEAIRSDWEKVGIAFLESLSHFKTK